MYDVLHVKRMKDIGTRIMSRITAMNRIVRPPDFDSVRKRNMKNKHWTLCHGGFKAANIS